MLRMPNLPPPDPPPTAWPRTTRRRCARTAEPPQFEFEPKDHLTLAGPDGLGLIDMESAGRVSGSRFHYLLGDLVRLELALMSWGMDMLDRQGLLRRWCRRCWCARRAMVGTGMFPEARSRPTRSPRTTCSWSAPPRCRWPRYTPTHLDASASRAATSGCSPCFRREAGAAGKDTRGIFRVHQFDKLEMFVYCLPEQSQADHDELLAIEEEIAQALGLHYRVQNIAAGDLGARGGQEVRHRGVAAGQERYRELTSCSNCTDFQARRLDVRYRAEQGPRATCTC